MPKLELPPIFCPQTNNYCFRAIVLENSHTPCAADASFSENCKTAEEALNDWKIEEGITQETSLRQINPQSIGLVNEEDKKKRYLAILKNGQTIDQRRQLKRKNIPTSSPVLS